MPATIHDISINDGTDTVLIRQCASKDYTPSNTVERAFANGSITSSAFFITSGDRRERFTTTDLGGALTAINPATGLCIDSGTIISQLANRSCTGITGGSSHFQIAGSKIRAALTSLRAQQGQAATIDGEIMFMSSDGFTDPVTPSIGNALITAGFVAQYQLAKVVISSSELTQVTGVTVNFGQNWELNLHNGHTFPTAAFLLSSTPTIDITHRNDQALASLGNGGAITNATVYLQKRAVGANVTDPASSAHIALSFSTGVKDAQSIGASGTGFAEPTLRLHGHAITASLTATIP